MPLEPTKVFGAVPLAAPIRKERRRVEQSDKVISRTSPPDNHEGVANIYWISKILVWPFGKILSCKTKRKWVGSGLPPQVNFLDNVLPQV